MAIKGVYNGKEEAAKNSSANTVLKLKDGQRVKFVFMESLDDSKGLYIHKWFGPATNKKSYRVEDMQTDLGVQAGFRPTLKVFINILNLETNCIQLLELSSYGVKELEVEEEENGELKGRTFAIKRTGSGIKTEYVTTPIDSSKSHKLTKEQKSLELIDFEKYATGIPVLTENDIDFEEEDDEELPKKKKAVKSDDTDEEETTKKSSKKKKVEVVEDEEDDEDEDEEEEEKPKEKAKKAKKEEKKTDDDDDEEEDW